MVTKRDPPEADSGPTCVRPTGSLESGRGRGLRPSAPWEPGGIGNRPDPAQGYCLRAGWMVPSGRSAGGSQPSKYHQLTSWAA